MIRVLPARVCTGERTIRALYGALPKQPFWYEPRFEVWATRTMNPYARKWRLVFLGKRHSLSGEG